MNRLPATVGYNLAYLAIGLALAWPGRLDAVVAGAYFAGVFLLKASASVADAIHDRAVDAANPEKSHVAAAVETIGERRAWSVLVTELVAGLSLVGYVALVTDEAVVLAGGAVVALTGFWYSYPPRLKERGLANHLVTTAVDIVFVVLALPYLAGRLDDVALAVGAVVFSYTFGYHLVHQAADAYYDREAGVETFALDVGVRRSVLVAGLLTAAGAGVSAVLGYYLTTAVLGAVTGVYAMLAVRMAGESLKAQTDTLRRWFAIRYVATALNTAVAASLLRVTVG